jgi:hypothetical protein
MHQQMERHPTEPPAAALQEPTESLNAVIADQARTRSAGELWTTAAGGGVNALILSLQFPSLHWLAAGFAGVAAYGIWGLIDRSIEALELKDVKEPGAMAFLKLVRAMAGVGGWIAAIAAVVLFTTAAVGGLSMPGR